MTSYNYLCVGACTHTCICEQVLSVETLRQMHLKQRWERNWNLY